ncbi:para-aminobenzoate synthetase / 4-amino-4-deoxychorismate lyase [Anaerolineales bacterium]|nr:para-aminobenzoate synthetase / 4-amino-4-deoxychorismate lyase [Anaerolineales bacterium]
MIQKDEVLLKSNEEWLHFANPQRVICAKRLDGVRGALEEIESLVEQNHWHAAGLVSYEAAPAFDSALHVLSTGDFPLLWFGLYPEPRVLQTSEVFKDLRGLTVQNWQPGIDRESYNTAIEKIKDYIARGRTYQVNYTMRLNAEFNGGRGAWEFFQHLAQGQNKYAAYVDTGRFVICSASPELFFKLDGNKIYSRPMKGTGKRGRTTREDHKQAEWLKSSLKNRAENVMIVDMVRNDLGRIAKVGSVQVPDLFAIEKYPTLFQMTSTVQAKTNASLTEIFSALFPCASITGAPKVSTMDIIAELETTPRKIYTGSIGYISPNRKAQFNVAIRTAIIDRETQSTEYGVGGGIIWDSTSADEYSEALLKARVLTESPRPFELLETLLWTPDEGFFLREKHLARMQDSADYFGFPFSAEKFAACLDQLSARFTSPQRVRILLGRSGQIKSESKDFQSQEKPFKVRLADNPVNTREVFLFHKTTRREMYPPVPADHDDLLLWNENDELTEFTIGNLVVEMDGKLFTPPIPCGLLAGTFRSHLLETGQVKERVIRKDELSKCAKVFLVNSVRKWVTTDPKVFWNP